MFALFLSIALFSNPVIKIKFEGNKSIPRRDLIGEVITKKGDDATTISPEFDIDRIIRHYRSKGFFKTSVDYQVEESERGLIIKFLIKEGPRPKIESIRFSGIEINEKKKILDLLEINIDDFYFDEKIINTENNIKDYYRDRGYPFATAISKSEPLTGSILFTVSRGDLIYIKDVNVQGLKSCNPRIVMREIIVKKGDKFSRDKLLKSQRRIYSLGFFSTINTEMIRHETDSIDLILRLKELKSRILNFGIGISIPISFLFSFGIEELNLWNQGHRFLIQPSFKINIESEWETKLEGRYTIPYLTPLRLNISSLPFFWYEVKNDFTRQTRGNEFRASKIFTENIQLYIANQYKYVVLKQRVDMPDTIKGITNSVRLQIMMDYRNEFFNPKKGIYFIPQIEYAGGLLGGANDFIKLELETRHFLPVQGHVIAQRLRLGRIFPRGDLAVYEEYYLGGQYSLRGYSEKSIGPDSISDERYGRIIANYNLEFRLTLPINFGAVGFFDIGYIDNEIDFQHREYLKSNIGFGLRYYTPIGPARADIGLPLEEEGAKYYLGIYHIF